MATPQLQRTQKKTWEAIFPNEQVTEQKSCLFVKKLLAVAISNITYLRNIFPEYAFGDKCLKDLNLKILREESSCPGACQVIKWLKGCFDALDKKYLKTLVIGIYADPDNPETVIESYTFKFKYNDKGEVDIYRNSKKLSSAYSSEETKNATIRLLRTLIILTNTLTSLPENVMMTMKLFYYDEVTPADYEPPGFKAADCDGFLFNDESTNIAVGEVSTPFHTVKMRVKTGSNRFEEQAENDRQKGESEGLAVTNTSLDASQSIDTENRDVTASTEPSVPFSLTGDAKANVDRATDGRNTPATGDSVASPGKPEDNDDEFKVRCPCGCNEDDGIMVMCSKCNFWQHGVCFLITNEDKAPTDHICDVCAKIGTPGLEPTDPHLCKLSSIAAQATCLWRRALSAVTEFKSVVAPQFAKRLGVETAVAQGLINRMEKEGFVNSSKRGKKLGKSVDKPKIMADGIPKYLKTPKALSRKLGNDENAMDVESHSHSELISEPDKKDPQNVDALIDQTNKINLNGGKRKSRKSPAQVVPESSAVAHESKGRRGRKRAHSKADNFEFEIAASQEKASKVQKDIAV